LQAHPLLGTTVQIQNFRNKRDYTQEKKLKRPLEEALDHMIAQSLEPHLQVGQELCKTLI
jgi:hypothetical protein